MIAFNVAGLLAEPPGAKREARLRDLYAVLGPDVALAGPLNGELSFARTNRGIMVRGRVHASLRRTCARCEDPFVEDVGVSIDEEFVPTIDLLTGAAIRPDQPEDEAANPINAHHEIELDDVLHDELLLTEPMHALCRHDCPGLCVECGQKLEHGEHDHGEPDIDPRLAGLAALLGRNETGKDA